MRQTRRPHQGSFPEPFGERTWEDVRKVICHRLNARWPGTDPEEIDDAAASAQLDLIDYWVNLESSTTGTPDRNWGYAVYRGTLYATTILVQRFQELETLQPLDGLPVDEEEFHPTLALTLQDDGPLPEELVIDNEDMATLRQAVEDMPSAEFEGWLSGWLSGKTVRQEAMERELSPGRISQIRKEGVARLKEAMDAA